MNSIIVVSFSNKPALLALLNALQLQEATSTEVIVVDSASFDDSADAVRDQFPQAKLLRRKSNAGFFAAANAGIDRAEGDVVVVCHADVFTDVHMLAELGDQAREAGGKKVVAVVPRLVSVDGSEQPFVGTLPKLGTGVAGALYPPAAWQCRVPFLDHVAEHEWARFVCVAFNRNLLEMIGVFDERFFLYCGDADLCARIHAKNNRILISKSVKVTHAGAAMGKHIPSHLVRILAKDQEQYAMKHFPAWQQGVVRAAGTVRGWFAKAQ
jgi:GT2 family glycosyltransferase